MKIILIPPEVNKLRSVTTYLMRNLMRLCVYYDIFDNEMSMEELSSTLEAMTNKKGPALDDGPSDLALNFSKACWHYIKENVSITLLWLEMSFNLVNFPKE